MMISEIKNNFSIIIPIFNEEGNIVNLYNEIDILNLDKYTYEIIFVDDCSSDKSYEILL